MSAAPRSRPEAVSGGAIVLGDAVDLAKRLISAAERWADPCRSCRRRSETRLA
jgi:hypothetical protein